jgi:hypothetical protein
LLVKAVEVASLAGSLVGSAECVFAQTAYLDEQRRDLVLAGNKHLKLPLSSQPRGFWQGRDLIAQTAGRQRVPQGLRPHSRLAWGKARANCAFAPLQHVGLETQVLSQGAIVLVTRNLVRLNRAPDAHGYARAAALEKLRG